MSEPIKPLSPVRAQTPSRGLGDDQDRHLERQRTWVLRRKTDQRERRSVERRGFWRRESERRLSERRSDDRRQDNRPREDRRSFERRQRDRRESDRRTEDRRALVTLATDQRTPESTAAPEPIARRKGLIDDYA
ncbi:hypothetical protein [Thiocystis violacea]|uniref:hypothetical protein n=1 Tax=Thiocystis violacea TaxID=13725 RepID=UPI00190753FE|nr:hypothetical protein [Thiocystis violacea]MBK1716726.1 hypothetical protein [Thiocystis violacea]